MQREHIDEALGELDRRLSMYTTDRYPVQHATAQFHRGILFLQLDEHERARAALKTATEFFDPRMLPVEHAKATNMLGVALRALGESERASGCFETAAAAFRSAELELEEGAALFNLGLAQRESGDLTGAETSFRSAQSLLDSERVPTQAAAAARELGATLLSDGNPEAAVQLLRDAVSLSGRANDEAGVGAACNILGLAHLATGDPRSAVEALRDAVAAEPRALRPTTHAMAKSNLALAYEAAGLVARARLAAQQAASVPEAPEPAVRQAREVLERLPSGETAVMLVLNDEPEAAWPRLLREEQLRWLDLAPNDRFAEAGTWIDAQIERGDEAETVAEAWLTALLELPPPQMERVIQAALEAADAQSPEEGDAWRHQTRRAMVRFPVPQWDRLRSTFDRVAGSLGQETSWS